MTCIKLKDEDNLVIQPFIIGNLLYDLKARSFLESDYYKDTFRDPLYNSLNEMTLESQGVIIILFYSFLVVPYERLKKELPDDYDDINIKIQNFINKNVFTLEGNYKDHDYLKHIRNATAHVKYRFVSNTSLTFIDDNTRKGYHLELTIPLGSIHLILNDLRRLIVNYFLNNREIV